MSESRPANVLRKVDGEGLRCGLCLAIKERMATVETTDGVEGTGNAQQGKHSLP